MKYERAGLTVFKGDRAICSAIASIGLYKQQEKEMQLICDLLNSHTVYEIREPGSAEVITDSYNRHDAIIKAQEFMAQQQADDRIFGQGSLDVVIVDTEADTEEPYTLEWEVEEDHYDGGRAVYNASRGV